MHAAAPVPRSRFVRQLERLGEGVAEEEEDAGAWQAVCVCVCLAVCVRVRAIMRP